ncbi:MAG: glutamine--tRNA ligase/YqeY domain fusion protein [Gemmatimonadetes bacterium]|nr:glutamine--tRNA ligase/YqeY domain fusion protein [Gemmatimonadota bacterium]
MAKRQQDFIRAMVAEDMKTGKYGGRVVTRFPPEPNGYLHIGHAKAICLDFGIAQENAGVCHLRFDDTNPESEDVKFVESIKEDVRWLGFDWGEKLFFASDYFERLYDFAIALVEADKAYVDSQSLQDIRRGRGTVTEAGTESPHRNRSVAENLDLFRRMRAGEFKDGEHVLRAKIDMAAKNMLMRDPVLYRIRHARHYRAGDAWCIYPLYDFTHCLSDVIEQITHSLCTLEFKDNRALYDWVLNAAAIEPPRPEQTEFARLNLDYTVLSKRKLVQVVEQGLVDGWDDPRMPTIAGLRRRGVTPEAIRTFCDMIGVARVDSRVDMEKLEYAIRDDLNKRVPRVMCVLRPLKVVILNYPEDQVEELDAPHYPRDVPQEGSRKVPFTRELYIERDDFMEDPPEKFFRLAPGREVRLRHAYLVKCVDVIKDDSGEITEIHCTYDPETKSGTAPDGRKVKGTVHWVSAAHSLPAEVRLYDRLFLKADPDDVAEGEDFTSNLNPDSKVVLTESRIEPSVADAPPGSRYQFERQGYFVSDVVDSSRDNLMFNRTVGLRDTWAKITVADSAEKGERRERGGRTAREGVTKPRQRTVADDRGASPKVAALTARFAGEFGLSDEQAKALAGDPTLATLFEEAVAVHDHPKTIASWIVGEVSRRLKEGEGKGLPFTGAQVAALVTLIDDGTISRTTAKDVFAEMSERGDHPVQIVERRGLRQLSDPKTIEPLVNKLVAENPDKAAQYRAGRTGLLGFFVGQVMKESGGRANPELVKEMVEARLS